MKDMMQHKGYYGSIHYDADEPLFYGKLEFIKALVSYEAKDAVGIKRAFQEAVDDYLALCEKERMTPEKPLKGSLNVRIGTSLHKAAALHAAIQGVSINELIKIALQHEIEQEGKVA